MGKIIIIYKTPISQKEIIQTLFSSWENIFLQSMFAGFFWGGYSVVICAVFFCFKFVIFKKSLRVVEMAQGVGACSQGMNICNSGHLTPSEDTTCL